MIKNTSKTSQQKIHCDKCNGNGVIPMPAELEALYSHIKKHGALSARILNQSAFGDVGRSAIHARLERLRKSGLVTRQLSGREYVYSVNMFTQ